MMGKGHVPSALWRCVTLLSFCTLLNAKEKEGGVELGPREPGDPKYWLHLKNIAFSEGELNPPFDGKLSDFSLTVKNPGVRSFTMTISLDLQHYDLLHLPKITVDGKVLKYSPLDPIEIPIFVNDTIAALDRTVSITLEDPSGKKFGGFLGIGGKTRSWDYKIRCLQPPEFQKVVTIDDIKVKNDKNEYLKPDKDADLETGQYWYTIPATSTGAYLKATCGKYASSMTVNGKPVTSGSDYWIDMREPHVTWLVECRYQDSMWTQSAVARSYQVHVSHLMDTFSRPHVRLMPQDGQCGEDEDVDGIHCRSAKKKDIRLIATFEESSVVVFLETGTKSIHLMSGIPTTVSLPHFVNHWHLAVKGLKEVKVPLKMVVAQECHYLQCPGGWVPKPPLDAGENAQLHLCYSDSCNLEDDGTTCCREGGTPCKEYGFHFKCQAGYTFYEKGACLGSPCTEAADHRYCCLESDEGDVRSQFNMVRKREWHKWFVDNNDKAEQVINVLGDRLEFYTSFKMQDKSQVDPIAKDLKKLVAEKFGCLEQDVSVKTKSEGNLEGFSVAVKSLEGKGIEDVEDQKCKELVSPKEGGKGESEVTEMLIQKHKELEANFTSGCKRVLAPIPEIKFKMLVEISKSADLGKDGEDEELDPEVALALRDCIIAIAAVPDKEKIQMEFKKLKSDKKIPKDDEMISIEGHLKLPRGKEGAKEILAAKLRNPKRISRKMNQILHKDIKKAEEDPQSRIVGGTKDYEVKSVELTEVSATPGGVTGYGGETGIETVLKTWLDLTTTTTTTLRVDGTALLRTASGHCVEAPAGRELGGSPTVQSCDHSNGHQAWFYTRDTHQLQSFLSLCLAVDLNGPAPQPGYQDYRTDTGPQVLQSWVAGGGPGPVHLWTCNGHWQQQFLYDHSSGQLQVPGSSNPGLCLQTQETALVIALCNKKTFAQQFWLEKSPAEPFLPAQVNSAMDVPIVMKPYFDGKVALKSSDQTYDYFKIAPFSKKRAAFYLTQGCSPVPTASCGTPMPDMPNVFVGESLVKVSKKVDNLPWMNAMKGPPKTSGKALCFYDTTCKTSDDDRESRLKQFLNGCNAGGKPMCRYCGASNFAACPKSFECANGGLESGTWTQEHKEWCCDKFSIGCDPPYKCMEDLDNWRKWKTHKKMWCCSYQMVGCEDECSKTDPATFRENHHYWCSTFGSDQEMSQQPAGKPEPSKFEQMVMQMFDRAPTVTSSSGHTALVVGISIFAISMGLATMVCRRKYSEQLSRSMQVAEAEPLVVA